MKTGVTSALAKEWACTRNDGLRATKDSIASCSEPVSIEEMLNFVGSPSSTVKYIPKSRFDAGKHTSRQGSRGFPGWNSLIVLIVSLLLVSVKCQPDCPNLPNTNGQPSPDGVTCDCITFDTTFWDGSNCLADCTVIKNADAAASSQGITCVCNSLYTWQATPLPLCVVTAGCTDTFASSTTINSVGECDCIDGFLWNAALARCEINCPAIQQATTLVSGTVDQCVCAPPVYQWNLTSRTCDLNCTLVSNSLNGTTTPAGECYCIPKYKYDVTTATCVLSCNDIFNTILSSPLNNATYC